LTSTHPPRSDGGEELADLGDEALAGRAGKAALTAVAMSPGPRPAGTPAGTPRHNSGWLRDRSPHRRDRPRADGARDPARLRPARAGPSPCGAAGRQRLSRNDALIAARSGRANGRPAAPFTLFPKSGS